MELPQLDYLPTMPVAIRRAAERFGDKPFMVMNDRQLTFAEADAASRRVAKQLLATGVGKGTRVAIHFNNSPEWLVAFFAVTRIGAIVIPLSTAYKPAELRKALRHGDVNTLIVPAVRLGEDNLDFVEKALPSLADAKDTPLMLPEAPFLRSILVHGLAPGDGTAAERPWARSLPLSPAVTDHGAADVPDGGITDEFLALIEAEVTPADWVMLVYTSGTTADPKGVIHTHGNYVRHADNLSRFIGVTSDDVQFTGMPFFWIGGLGLSVGNALNTGFTLIGIEKFDPKEALELVLTYKPTGISMWGQLLQRFREYVKATGADVSNVPAFAPDPSGVPYDAGLRHNSLGQTETFGPHTAAGPEAGRILPEELRGSFGLRVPYVEHKIIDPDTGAELPPGVEGELAVRGYSIAQGQYKRERHEALDDDGWLHTGDRCYFRDGLLFFTGRTTEMIKTSGSNVAPREVELTLETFPGIALAVVIGVPDERRGQAVGAVLVPTPGATVDPGDIKARALEELSNYKVPTRILVIPDEELPVLGNGKPDKLKMRDILATVPDA